MNKEDLLDQQIERYVHNRMGADERIAFEEELHSDDKLRRAVDILSEFISLYNHALFNLKKKLDDTESNLKEENFFEEGGEG